jgi:hypothetical protein
LPAAARWAGSAVALCGQHHAAGNGARRRSAAAKNLATLKASNGKVVNTNTLSFLLSRARRTISCLSIRRFQRAAGRDAASAGKQRLAADEALIYVESEVENGLPPVPHELASVS